MRLAVEESAGLKIVSTRFQIVVGRKGTARQQNRIKAGISFGFHKKTKTTSAQAKPTHVARE